MGPVTEPDRHNSPRLIDELVPCLAAMHEQILVGFENPLESQLSRMNCQTFSIGLNTGDFGGRAMIVIFAGTTRPVDICHPA
jgi:hypothetical protein